MPLRFAILLLSAGAIAYEILLMRLLSIVQWHHFAAMVISLALLGYAASGTVLSLFRARLLRRFKPAFATSAALFGPLAAGCFALGQRLPFNALETLWDPSQLPLLGALYLLLSLPFLAAALAIGLALARLPEDIPSLYGSDLAGASLGAAAIIGALFAAPAERCLALAASLGPLAAAVSCLDRRSGRSPAAATLLAAAALATALVWPHSWLAPRLSPFKGLRKALEVPGSEVVAERSSPLGWLAVVRSSLIPLRFAPGLSFGYPHEPPEQLGVFRDGDALTVLDRDAGDPAPFGYLDYLPSALPYRLVDRPHVVVLGAGGGAEVRSALLHGATAVDAVDSDARLVGLVRDEFGAFGGDLLARPGVRVHVAEPRGFFARRPGLRVELIQLPMRSGAGGAESLREGYAYTVEALAAYLGHLAEDGVLAITTGFEVPPRQSLKLIATAAAALEREGISDPGARVAAIRAWNVVVILVKRERFAAADLDAIREFCAARSFDLGYYPGMAEAEANRFNLLDEPYLYRGAAALLGPGRASFLADYKFDIEPATDDRPYVFDFFRWRSLPEFVRLPARGGAALIERGYVILVATLVQAGLIGLVLVLLPLAFLRRRRAAGGTARVGIYFLALGLGFLFLEIAWIQRLTLYLAHPLLAAALVLASFLLFAGLGSAASGRARRLAGRRGWRAEAAAAVAVGGVAVAQVALLLPLLERTLWLPTPARAALAIALVAPLAFVMGMPFPLGLQRLAAARSDWLPWAWGLNGWASVLSAVLATVIAIHRGFTTVVLAAVALYLVAALCASALDRSGGGPA